MGMLRKWWVEEWEKKHRLAAMSTDSGARLSVYNTCVIIGKFLIFLCIRAEKCVWKIVPTL